MRRFGWSMILVAAGGCGNPCQALCVRMADYAEECNLSVSDADISTCKDAQADPVDPSVCREFGNAAQIRDEWTCDDLAVYFQ
jgi:hypothetical protein